jgi:hypothetical protein
MHVEERRQQDEDRAEAAHGEQGTQEEISDANAGGSQAQPHLT